MVVCGYEINTTGLPYKGKGEEPGQGKLLSI